METEQKKEKRKLPHLGMRIIKSGLVVLICLSLEYMFGGDVALISSIAALMCIGTTLQSSLRTSLASFFGTAIGGLGALPYVSLAQQVDVEWLYLILMPLGLMLIIYLCIVLGMRESATMSAFTYVAVLIVPFAGTAANPYLQALIHIADTATGVAIGLLVNRFVVPPKNRPVSDVHIPSTRFSWVRSCVEDRLTGLEELILIDTAIVDHEEEEQKRRGPLVRDLPIDMNAESVSIQVPKEISQQRYINGVYITERFSVIPFYLRRDGAYIHLPLMLRPITVVWHAACPEKETYGILHPRQMYEPTLLHLAHHPHPHRYRRRR